VRWFPRGLLPFSPALPPLLPLAAGRRLRPAKNQFTLPSSIQTRPPSSAKCPHNYNEFLFALSPHCLSPTPRSPPGPYLSLDVPAVRCSGFCPPSVRSPFLCSSRGSTCTPQIMAVAFPWTGSFPPPFFFNPFLPTGKQALARECTPLSDVKCN